MCNNRRKMEIPILSSYFMHDPKAGKKEILFKDNTKAKKNESFKQGLVITGINNMS